MLMPKPRLRRLLLRGMFFVFCASAGTDGLQPEALPFPRALVHASTCYLQSNSSSTSWPATIARRSGIPPQGDFAR